MRLKFRKKTLRSKNKPLGKREQKSKEEDSVAEGWSEVVQSAAHRVGLLM